MLYFGCYNMDIVPCTVASEERRKNDHGLQHGTMESDVQQDGTTGVFA